MNNRRQNKSSVIFMKSKCPSTDRLIAYKEKQLTRREVNDIERHLVDCEFCNDVLEGIESVSDISKAQKTISELKSIILQRINSKRGIHELSFKYLSVAAIIVLTISLVLLNRFPQNSLEEFYNNNFKMYPNLKPITRGNIFDSIFIEAMQLYEIQDLKAAKIRLEVIPLHDRNYARACFYLGNIALYNDDYENAVQKFLEAMLKSKTTLAIHARWYLALTALKTENIELVKILLYNLIEIDSVYKNKSIELLIKLETRE